MRCAPAGRFPAGTGWWSPIEICSAWNFSTVCSLRWIAPHYGGEFLVVPRDRLDPLLDRAERAWTDALERFRSRTPHFVTEEHHVSYALRDLEVTDLSTFVRRIWTAPSYRTVAGDEHELTLWHLPAEKRRGFTALHAAATDPYSWWWTADRDGFRAQVGTAVGVPRRPPGRLAYDLTRGTAARIQRADRQTVGAAPGYQEQRGRLVRGAQSLIAAWFGVRRAEPRRGPASSAEAMPSANRRAMSSVP